MIKILVCTFTHFYPDFSILSPLPACFVRNNPTAVNDLETGFETVRINVLVAPDFCFSDYAFSRFHDKVETRFFYAPCAAETVFCARILLDGDDSLCCLLRQCAGTASNAVKGMSYKKILPKLNYLFCF